MLHPEPNRTWQSGPSWGVEPDADAGSADDDHDLRRRRELCIEVLSQMSTSCAGPYPFGDAVYLIDALDPRSLQAPPSRARPFRWLVRFGEGCLTWLGTAHRIELPIGKGSDGAEQSWASDISLRGLHS